MIALALVAALASVSTTPVVAEPEGCYRATPALTYSATGAPEHGDSAWAIIRLFPDGKARRPLLLPRYDGRSHWTLTSDTLRLVVLDGLAGWNATLTATETGWRGTAEYLTDAIAVGQPPFRQPIVLVRQACIGQPGDGGDGEVQGDFDAGPGKPAMEAMVGQPLSVPPARTPT